jgi:uncharacterized protein YbjT (DUF2867 family)
VARLAREGHSCVTVARGRAPPHSSRHIRFDVGRAIRQADWTPALEGVGAVINAAGALQDADLPGVHIHGISALYAACEQRGVRRVIHLSAIGVDHTTPSAFSETKRRGEQSLMSRDLDWVVLRPSVVVGRPAYGGSALIRGLAALPIVPELPDTAPIQPVHLDDVVDTVIHFLDAKAPKRLALDLAGPERLSFVEAVGRFRHWMRWPPAWRFAVPRGIASILYRLGDLIRALGWPTPLSSTARAEMARGAVGDPSPWSQATMITPRPLSTTLLAEPAPVQDRWFARLYILKPFIFGVFGLFWIATGLVSLGPGWDQGMDLMREGGVSERGAALTVVAGALADIAIGAAILWRPASRYGLWAALAITLTYVVIGTALVPRLWSEPLGPMLKIWPIIMLNLVAMAIWENR